MILLLALAPFALAHADEESEVRIKAAFLYKFGGFVEWPPPAFADARSPFIIGVLSADSVAAELERVVAGRTVHGRPVEVRRLQRGDATRGLHVLFVGQSESARLPEILRASKGRPLLVVTESDSALEQGSVINFVVVDDKVRFDVALAPAGRSNLRISARLLSVARNVVPG